MVIKVYSDSSSLEPFNHETFAYRFNLIYFKKGLKTKENMFLW